MNDTNLSRVDNVRCGIPWLVLPTVYSDALSYEEQFGKFCKALNDVIANVNVLPDYIKQEIENYINSGIIGDQIEQTIGNWILNVKYPPTENITPAKGDGTTDDTETFQQCIDYAAANGGGCLFVPAGKYLLGPLTLKVNVSIVGFDRYSTVLVCKGGSTGAVITSTTGNSAFLGLTVDARMSTQVNDVNGISLMGQNYQIDNVIVADAYNAIQFVGDGHFQCTNVVIEQVVNKGMIVSGANNEVHVSDVFVSSAGKNATCAFDLSGVNGFYEVKSAISVNEYAILLGGSHNMVRAFVSGTEATVDDTGIGNSFEIYNDVIKKNINNAQVNVSGDLSVAASHIMEESDAKTVSVNGTLQVNAANSNENVLGTKKIVSETTVVEGAEASINTSDFIINSQNPVTYKKPQTYNKYFDSVLFKDSDDNYNVLVANDSTENLPNIIFPIETAGAYSYRYIDGVNGNDDNDGLTEFTAWKTMQKFFNMLVNGYTDIRCHIISSGIYTVAGNAFPSCALHIIADSGVDATLLFSVSNATVVFYDSHINFQNIKIGQAEVTEYRIAFENCSIGLDNVEFTTTDRVDFNGCAMNITNLTARVLQLERSTGTINGLTITNTDNTRNAIVCNWCSGLRLYGQFNFADLIDTGTKGALFSATYSVVNLMFTFPVTPIANKYYRGLFASNTLIWLTRGRENAFNNNALTGIVDENMVKVVGTTVLPPPVNTGDVRYSNNKLQYYNGSSWVDVPA